MTRSISRRAFLTTAAAALAGPALAQTAPVPYVLPRLRPDYSGPAGLEFLINGFGLTGQTVCAMADAATGQMIEGFNADTPLPPASVAKAVTAAYALFTLGPLHRFQTRVLVSGPVAGGVLGGDVILAGGGDPVLDTDDLAALAQGLAASGIREVRGRFLVWDGMLPTMTAIDPGQPDHVGYSPAVSGIALNFNRVHFEWIRDAGDYTITMEARTGAYRPAVSIATMELDSRRAPVFVYRRDGAIDRWSVARSALGANGARWMPIRDPAAYAGDVFRTLARAEGLSLPRAERATFLPDTVQEIAVIESEPLETIVRGMMKFSTNLTAEMIGMMATRAAYGRPDSLRASAASMSAWLRDTFGVTNADFVDHSGLGHQSRISANALVKMLAAAGLQDILRPLTKEFPLRDSKGRTIKNHPVAVEAKTGTLNFVSGLGGYMTTPSGRDLAFAIFSADLDRRAALTEAERERPPGGKTWNRKSKWLQQRLIERWADLYDEARSGLAPTDTQNSAQATQSAPPSDQLTLSPSE